MILAAVFYVCLTGFSGTCHQAEFYGRTCAEAIRTGRDELERLGFEVRFPPSCKPLLMEARHG